MSKHISLSTAFAVKIICQRNSEARAKSPRGPANLETELARFLEFDFINERRGKIPAIQRYTLSLHINSCVGFSENDADLHVFIHLTIYGTMARVFGKPDKHS